MNAFLNKQIGWIGTGVMGKSMCLHLLNKNIKVNIYTRTEKKAQNLIQKGASWMKPQLLSSNSDIVFLMLGYPHDVQQLCFGKTSIIQKMKPGSFLIDHTTSKPSLAEKIFIQCKKRNIKAIDAPVTGGDVGARQGKLVTFCGGQSQHLKQIKPLLQAYSKTVEYFGSAGKGQHAKLTNQIILAGNMIGMVEGLLYASKMGMSLNQIIQTIKQGAASSTSLSVLGSRIANNNYDPGFYVQHYVKDMQIALEEANRMNLCLPNLALVKQFYVGLKAQGGQKLGTQALIKVLQQMNNHKVNNPNTRL